MSLDQLQRLELASTVRTGSLRDQRNWFPQKILNRLKHNFDVRILTTGEGGIGKSWGSLRLAEMVDEDYVNDPKGVIEDKLTFTADGFVEAVKTQQTGSQLIFDEPGQEWYSREFMSQANILISKTVIGFRYKRFVSVFNIPVLGMIDKTARVLCQFKMDFLRRGFAEVQRILPSRFQDSAWYKGLGDLQIQKPSVKLRHAYEKKKVAVQDEVYEQYHDRLVGRKDKEKSDESIIRVIRSNEPKFKQAEEFHVARIAGFFHIGRDRSTRIKAQLDMEDEEDAEQ